MADNWIEAVPGIRDILDANGVTLPRVARLKLGPGLTATYSQGVITIASSSGGGGGSGGGSGAIAPMSTVRYVDAGTAVSESSRNGSQAAPYATIQAAINSLDNGGIVRVAPGAYTEDLTVPLGVTIEGTGVVSASVSIVGNITLGDVATLRWLSVNGDIDGGAQLQLEDVACSGTASATTLIAAASSGNPSLSVVEADNFYARGYGCGATTVEALDAFNCAFFGNIAITSGVSPSRLRQCSFESALSLAGTGSPALAVDGWTDYGLTTAPGVSVSGVSKTVYE
jgi:hypothetical protein